MASNRRSFLRKTALASLATTPALQFVFRRRAAAQESAGFGPLVTDPEGILDLPEGFSYKILDSAGDVMSDGYSVPDLPDGMGAFAGAEAGHEREARARQAGERLWSLDPIPHLIPITFTF